jgi:hypothetical protein
MVENIESVDFIHEVLFVENERVDVPAARVFENIIPMKRASFQIYH